MTAYVEDRFGRWMLPIVRGVVSVSRALGQFGGWLGGQGVRLALWLQRRGPKGSGSLGMGRGGSGRVYPLMGSEQGQEQGQGQGQGQGKGQGSNGCQGQVGMVGWDEAQSLKPLSSLPR